MKVLSSSSDDDVESSYEESDLEEPDGDVIEDEDEDY